MEREREEGGEGRRMNSIFHSRDSFSSNILIDFKLELSSRIFTGKIDTVDTIPIFLCIVIRVALGG